MGRSTIEVRATIGAGRDCTRSIDSAFAALLQLLANYLKRSRFCATTLTNDYWDVNLRGSLATSARRSAPRFAYQASVIRLGARGLYSPLKIADMVDPVDRAVKGSKAFFEQHCLYPTGHLKKLGITDTRQVNQIANVVVVEWPDNIDVRDKPP